MRICFDYKFGSYLGFEYKVPEAFQASIQRDSSRLPIIKKFLPKFANIKGIGYGLHGVFAIETLPS